MNGVIIAGGVLFALLHVSDRRAKRAGDTIRTDVDIWWTLADAEGNEADGQLDGPRLSSLGCLPSRRKRQSMCQTSREQGPTEKGDDRHDEQLRN
jgi:hypothetical protein